jgi:hypothetical protein
MLKKIKIVFLTIIAFSPLLFVSAQGSDPTGGCPPGKLCNPLKGSDNLLEFLEKVLDLVIRLGAIIALLAIIYSGFLFVIAGGSDEKIKTAKKTLLYTVIGTALILGARVILEVIQGTIESLQ